MSAIRRRFAVLVDADAVLLQSHPAQSRVSCAAYIPELLAKLHRRLEGALALRSGREVAELDGFCAPHSFPAAGLYGCEMRLEDAIIAIPSFSVDALDAVHGECLRFADSVLLAHCGDCFSLRHREGSYEIIPSSYAMTKAFLELMQSEPFFGRMPIMIGGNTVGEMTLEAANLLGGSTIRLGQGGYTCAKQSVTTPLAVHRLLAGFIDDFDWLIRQLNTLGLQCGKRSEPDARGVPLAGLPQRGPH